MKFVFEIYIEPDHDGRVKPKDHTNSFLGEEVRLLLEDDALKDGFWVGDFHYAVKKVVTADP